MIAMESLLVGTDAEVPLVLSDGTLFPVIGLVGGTKDKPRPLGKLGPGFMVQEDNVNLEFNIPPAKTAKEFASNINKATKEIQKLLPPTIRPDWQRSSMRYKPEFLTLGPLRQFGCTPDYNGYTMEENPRPEPPEEGFRTASAHVHIGWENPTNEDRRHLVKMLDLHLSLPFVPREDVERKQLYGKAGCMRPKEYGVEYRSLSNRWLPTYSEFVFQCVVRAVDAVNHGVRLKQEDELLLINAINTGQIDLAVENLALNHDVPMLW